MSPPTESERQHSSSCSASCTRNVMSGGVPHDLEWLSRGIEDRVVARLHPDLPAIARTTPEFAALVLAPCELDQSARTRLSRARRHPRARRDAAPSAHRASSRTRAGSFRLRRARDRSVSRSTTHSSLIDGRELTRTSSASAIIRSGDVDDARDDLEHFSEQVANWIERSLDSRSVGRPSPRAGRPPPALRPRAAFSQNARYSGVSRLLRGNEHAVVLAAHPETLKPVARSHVSLAPRIFPRGRTRSSVCGS